MKIFTNQRFLTVYSSVLTLAFGVMVWSGFSAGSKPATFDQINVHRINVVEPDGTLRMVISDHAELPGIITNGKEQPFVRQAGMIFYNDEGSENGGLFLVDVAMIKAKSWIPAGVCPSTSTAQIK